MIKIILDTFSKDNVPVLKNNRSTIVNLSDLKDTRYSLDW